MDEKNKKASDDIQRRRFMLKINNPEKYEMSHEKIIEAIHSAFAKQGIIYFCLCDEIGESGTYHTHIFIMTTKKSAGLLFKTRFHTHTSKPRYAVLHRKSLLTSKKRAKKTLKKKKLTCQILFTKKGKYQHFSFQTNAQKCLSKFTE